MAAISGGGGSTGNGPPTLILNGTGSQTISGTASGALPNIEIAQGSGGSVTLSNSGLIQLAGPSTWTYVSGTVNPGTSTVQFGTGNANLDINTWNAIDAPTMSFNNVILNNQSTSSGGQQVTAMNVAGNLTVNDASDGNVNLDSGYLNLSGNLILESGGLGMDSEGNLNFVGTGSQTITQSSPGTIDEVNGGCNLVVNKPSGSLTLESNVTIGGGNPFEILSGTVNLNGYVLDDSGNVELVPGAVLNCDSGCGSGTHCGQGAGDLLCGHLDNSGGTINP